METSSSRGHLTPRYSAVSDLLSLLSVGFVRCSVQVCGQNLAEELAAPTGIEDVADRQARRAARCEAAVFEVQARPIGCGRQGEGDESLRRVRVIAVPGIGEVVGRLQGDDLAG